LAIANDAKSLYGIAEAYKAKGEKDKEQEYRKKADELGKPDEQGTSTSVCKMN
jgi:hypothetical protein